MSAAFVAGSDTSQAAAAKVDPRSLWDQVMDLMRTAGPEGLTCSQVEEAIGKSHQSLSARLRELVLSEQIVDTGRRRKGVSGRSQRVYVAVDPVVRPRLFPVKGGHGQ